MDADPSQPTQPATQQVLDPRRLGRNNSGLNDGDIADVLIILHPASQTAIRIVEEAAQNRPQHVLFRNSYDSMNGSLTDIEEQETIIINASGERLGRQSRAGADLALRMSSARILKSKQLGFIFGRNHQSADIIFGQDSGKRISNQHFRIYLNVDGVLMIEDMSTNGTIVDDALLKCKDLRFNKIRMLTSGSIICIQNANDAEMIKFIVRIPSRTDYMDRFSENLRNFITECSPDFGEEQDKALKRITKQYGGPTMKWNGGDRYNIIGQIGKGAFATVYQLATKMDGKLLAAKELEKRRFMKNGMLDKKIDNEMRIMQSLRHENIVEFVEYYDQGDYLYIIMEYVRQGDLQAYLNQGVMKEDVARTMAQQILQALTYLHRQQITHRDIKPDNILIADLNPFTVKLSDFGLSKVVKHDETFLKTFCGTLLYCAPEVFPDYGNAPAKGTKRRRGTKTYHSYSSSVDIWSFGGVLWYALCGEPPFKGIADATGEAMFNNIMISELDPSPLYKKGVSPTCIDLLVRMLRTDPALRPTDWECLNHPWLKDGAVTTNDPALQSIKEEDESEDAEHQLSQLNIEGEGSQSDEEGDILSDDELMGFVLDRDPKRIRTDPRHPRHQLRDQDDSSADPSFQSSHFIDEDESFRAMPTPKQPRLFGEIGESALGSSAVLNVRANSALASEGDSIHSFHYLHPSNTSQTLAGAEEHGPSTAPPLLERGFSSPSLLGAESLVRDLNMTEAGSPVSRTQSPLMPATPKTPDVFQHSSLNQSSKHSQISEPTPKARTSGMNRQISLPLTASYYYDPMDPSTHNLEYASRVSGYDFVSSANTSQDEQTPNSVHNMSSEPTTEIAHTTINQGCSAIDIMHNGASAYDTNEQPTTPNNADAQSPSAAVPSVPAELDFKPPPRRLGKLVSTQDSFIQNLVLNIDKSKTSWGRLLNNTIVYENSRDTRIPKTAFIIFWYSSAGQSRDNVEELSQQGKNWTSLDDLHVGIWTCATHGISINGKHLRQKDERGRALFGHLHTGDVIQVYHDSRGTECLKFKCEFYLGSGQHPRSAGDSFNTLLGNKLSQE
ncbi:Protein kinase protein rad53 [Coniothyrium glycines]